jgi:hypothetical protein
MEKTSVNDFTIPLTKLFGPYQLQLINGIDRHMKLTFDGLLYFFLSKIPNSLCIRQISLGAKASSEIWAEIVVVRHVANFAQTF